MKRIVLLCVVACLLVSSSAVMAAENTGPDDRLEIQPIPPPAVEEEETDPLEAIAGYVGNRFRDFADILTLKLGWGTHRSLGFQLRLLAPFQIGAGIFEGWVLAIDRGCIGTMKEVEVEAGISVFYPTLIARKIIWQTEEAKRRNVFFGDVGDKKELTIDDLKAYDDGNQNWFTSTAQVQLPCLPKIEITINWGEIPDFILSFIPISGLRVPPPFFKHDGPGGEDATPERIPAPSIFWHGQEKYEKYD